MTKPVTSLSGGDPGRDDAAHPLAPIMMFLSQEIDQSSAILRDLAACLSDVIVTFSELDDAPRTRSCISSATQALQTEDRIQQRLSDLRRAVMVMEHMLQAGLSPFTVDLNRTIIDQLQLCEMRDAYAASVGMTDREMSEKPTVTRPSAGDVDLF